MQQAENTTTAPAERRNSQRWAFLFTFFLGLILVPVSFATASLLSVDLIALLNPDVGASVIGFSATVPLALLLVWFMRTSWRPLADLRHAQIEFLAQLGFDLTPMRIALLSLVAGISEEMFFRGVLQTAIDRHASTPIAIVLPSILFGALHAKTLLYAIAAGVAGAYFGFLFWQTGSLIAPIITHAIYDYIALEWARRAINDR